jgi:hypothetical protein
MIIELVEEKKVGHETFYAVIQDGKFISGSCYRETAEKLYETIVEQRKNDEKDVKIILKSEEIIVS